MVNSRRFYLFLLIFLVTGSSLHAQRHLQVRMSKPAYQPGDTILFEVTASQHKTKLSTLHLVVEEITHQRYWKLRYPMLNGVSTAALVLPDSFPAGRYAFNFRLQGPGIHLMGRVDDKRPPQQLNYVAKAADKDIVAKTIAVDQDGYFQVPNLLFEDRATFVFSPTEKVYGNSMRIELEAPCDSMFTSLADTSFFADIGDVKGIYRDYEYAFNAAAPGETGELTNVTVKGKKKTLVDQYSDQYVRGFFEGQGIVFDGLEAEDFSRYSNVAEILNGKVPGMDVTLSRNEAFDDISIRGRAPVFFIDEIQTDYEAVTSLSTSDIAMIKVFRPPFMGVPMGSAGGAIAVYTKRGTTGSKVGPQYRFVINGYTPQEFLLR